MKPLVFFRGGWNALINNKKRSILTIIGIVVGIAAVSTIMSIGRGFENYVMDSLNPDEGELLTVDIQFQADDYVWMYGTNEPFFSDRDLQSIRFLPGVNEVEVLSMDTGYASLETIINDDEAYIDITMVEGRGRPVLAGRSLNVIDNTRSSRVVVIPLSLTEKSVHLAEDSIGKAIQLGEEFYTIVGVYEGDIDATGLFAEFMLDDIEIPFNSYLRYHNEGNSDNTISITVDRGVLPSEVADRSLAYLREEGYMHQRGTYEHWDMSGVTDGLSQVLNGITLFIASVAGISLFIAGIGVMNMMYISVSERTKEIGVRRALGATQKSIQAQFVLEGVMMTSIGGLMGYAFGIIFSAIATSLLPFSAGLDLMTILVSLGISSLVGLVFSYAPAKAASKKEVIEIL